MDNKKSKQPIPKKYRLAIYRYRFRRDHPEEAKARAMKGSINNGKRWTEKNKPLVELIRTQFPATFDTYYLRYMLNQIPYGSFKTGNRFNPLSLQKRLIRRGLIKYDTGLGKWINLTLLQLPESQ